ncbi:MAG: tetratricopeptide repeat protein, partial [Lentimicrobium sp.]|nr:tetratricopeptide repeat protein [Lentimicrobium sp.]
MNLNAVFHSVMQARALIVKIVFVVFIGISVQDIYADNRIDSLKTRLGFTGADTSLLRVYMQLGDRYAKLNQADSALSYYNRALKIAEKPANNSYSYAIFNQIGLLFASTGNYSISLEYYFKMLQMLDDEASRKHDKLKLDNKYASLYVQMGTCYFYLENLPKAHVYYQKCLEKVLQKATINAAYKETESQLILYINIGSAYLSGKSFDKALVNFEKALEMNKPLDNQIYYGVLYNNLGIVYKEKKAFNKAFDFYIRALQIRKVLKDTAGMAQVYNNLGDCYYLTGNYQYAIESLNNAINLSRKVRNIRSEMIAANFLSLASEKVGSLAEALDMQRL